MLDKQNCYMMLRYLAQGLSIYLIFRFLPELTNGNIGSKLTQVDILMITILIMLMYILFENLCGIFNESVQMTPNEKIKMCSSVCSIQKQKTQNSGKIEGMSSLTPENTNYVIPQHNTHVPNSTIREESSLKNKLKFSESKLNYNPNDVFTEDSFKSISSSDESTELKQNFEENKNKPLSLDIERDGSRQEDGVIIDDMQYDTDYNHLPMAKGFDSTDYEYGYSYLPPKDWYPQPPFPPVCVTDKQCPVCPVYTTGTPIDVKEWNDSIRITPPDNINTKFIKKLNAGR